MKKKVMITLDEGLHDWVRYYLKSQAKTLSAEVNLYLTKLSMSMSGAK